MQRVQVRKVTYEKGSKINWIKITEAVLKDKLRAVNLIKGIVGNDFDMSQLPPQIGLLHLDLPKDAQTLIPILKGAFPRLAYGSIIAFQDYAYQLSNELICFFELLEQKKYIKPINIAASSIYYKVLTEEMSVINLVDTLGVALEQEDKLISMALNKYANYPNIRGRVDRRAWCIRSFDSKEAK